MKKVRSADGTSLAFEEIGQGPPLILIAGAFCDRRARTGGTPLAALLSASFHVVSYDRRGRGDSGDTEPYAIEREVEDVAALMAELGGAASLYGMSSGSLLALEAAARGLPVQRLGLYEPPLVLDDDRRPTDALADELAALSAAGRRSEAAERFLAEVVGVPAPALAGMKAAPMWDGLTALAHTLSYDVRLTARAPSLLERLATVRVPAVLLDGAASPTWMHEGTRRLAAALPEGRRHTLEGQGHDPDIAVLAAALIELLAQR